MRFYEVGGCVRDSLLGVPSKDVDFVVVTELGFEGMRKHLVDQGFRIFLENPEFVTIRAQVPAGHPLRARTRDADFVLARLDGPSSDGRRPDFVEPGTLRDDLSRRDFTVNALARDPITGEIIDFFGGQDDLAASTLKFVGDPMTRINEDGLRVMRALRFVITKAFLMEERTHEAVCSPEAAVMLECVSVERVREELEKMLAFDTLAALDLLAGTPAWTRRAIFRDGLRLSATLKK